jgi:hypothetical protein
VIKRKYYINKRCTKMARSKNAKEPNEKKGYSIIYQRTKVQKVGMQPKRKGYEVHFVITIQTLYL